MFRSTKYRDNDEAESLDFVLIDKQVGLKAILTYTVYRDFNAIVRSVRYVNVKEQPKRLLRALSMGIDFAHADFDLLHLSGSWARERQIQKRALTEMRIGLNLSVEKGDFRSQLFHLKVD